MRTIAIEINGNLRDFTTRFRQYYENEFEEREIIEPIDDFNILKSFTFYEGELEEFITSYAYELYAKSTQPAKDLINEWNLLYHELKQLGFRVILIGRENIKMRGLTSFYLSNFSSSFYYDEIRYYDKYDEYFLADFDFIVSSNRNLLGFENEITKLMLFNSEENDNTIKVNRPLDIITEIQK